MRFVPLAVLLCCALGGAACGSSRAVPHPFPGAGSAPSRPSPPEAAPTVGRAAPRRGDGGEELARRALALLGSPYRNGGTDPSGFDCSGFVQYVYAERWQLPRPVSDLYRIGHKVDRDELRPGDLVFFTTVSRGASHVGVALGGGAFVHAPSSRGVVRVEHLSASYWDRRYVGARRLD